MNKALRCNCSGFSIVFLILGIAFQNNQAAYEQANLEHSFGTDSHSVASFIKDNLSTFVLKCNDYCNMNWEAASIERMFDITIYDCGNTYEGVFLDFDSENGYATVADNYVIYDINFTGESPFLNVEFEQCKYISSKGYFYLFDGEYLSVDSNDKLLTEQIDQQFSDSHYNGQQAGSTGCGNIIYPDLYIKDRYGDGWTLEKSKSLSMYGCTQYNYSCYIENQIVKDSQTNVERAVPYSEGNCWFISSYNLLRYMSSTRWFSMPSVWNVVSYDPRVEEPNLYSKYFDASGSNKSKILFYNNNADSIHQYDLRQHNNSTIYSFEKLYVDVRHLIDTTFKKVNGGTISESCSVIERIAEKYGYEVDAVEDFSWSQYLDTVAAKISSGLPSLWSTSIGTYGTHTMAVCGYRYYAKTTGWWIFQQKQTKIVFEIRDGWTSDSRFYDMSGYIGFGAIAVLNL